MRYEERVANYLEIIASFINDNRKELNTIIKAQAKIAKIDLEFFERAKEIKKTIDDDIENQTIVS